MLCIGIVINPVAGAGGAAALKGSDAEETRRAVFSGELKSPCVDRVLQFLTPLMKHQYQLQFVCARGPMGADVLERAGMDHILVEYEPEAQCRAEDTRKVCENFLDKEVDLLVFAGGDGTARDVFDVVGSHQLCLGLPAGVKMQSGVFAVHPRAATDLVVSLLNGEAVVKEQREVRDIDEQALQKEQINSRFYGELIVPVKEDLVQQVKQGSGEIDELVILDIADEIRERIHEINEDLVLVFGPGSTTRALQAELNFEGSLLGVDLFYKDEKFLDVDEAFLFEYLSRHPAENIRLILTVIGGQGYVLGRGNQQLSARILAGLELKNLWIVVGPHKLQEFEGRPLRIDSGDSKLDARWSGLLELISGYQKISLHRMV